MNKGTNIEGKWLQSLDVDKKEKFEDIQKQSMKKRWQIYSMRAKGHRFAISDIMYVIYRKIKHFTKNYK